MMGSALASMRKNPSRERRLSASISTALRRWRTMRRADVPVSFSQGYSPHMKLAFGDALPVGMSSDGDHSA